MSNNNRCSLHGLAEDQAWTNLLRNCWRIGDAYAASQLTDIPYIPKAIPEGLDLEQELAFIIADARFYIEYVYRSTTT